MDEVCTYHIAVQGQMDENAFNATSPQQITIRQVDETTTRLVTTADQSGLIGLIRHLHQRGFLILSVQREQ